MLDVLDNFVGTDKKSDVLGAESESRYPVAYHVDIDKLSLSREGVRAREEQVGVEGLATPVSFLCPAISFLKGADEDAFGIIGDLVQNASGFHGHGISPRHGGGAYFLENLLEENFFCFFLVFGVINLEMVDFQGFYRAGYDLFFHRAVFLLFSPVELFAQDVTRCNVTFCMPDTLLCLR